MRKSDKKRENGLRVGLTEICEQALKDIDGFQWLTHLVDYNRFPNSLKIVLVFDTPEQIKTFDASSGQRLLEQNIATLMLQLNINIKSVSAHILYDSEAECSLQHQGDWTMRLSLSS